MKNKENKIIAGLNHQSGDAANSTRILNKKENWDEGRELMETFKILLSKQKQKIKEEVLGVVDELKFTKRDDGYWVNKNTTMSEDLHRVASGNNEALKDIKKKIEDL